jgi:uncharacterized protein
VHGEWYRFVMDRRDFLRTGAIVAGGLALGACVPGKGGGTPTPAGSCPPLPTTGFPYGPLGAADANGMRLPAGFTSRVVATTGLAVGSTSYLWHHAPDGGACIPAPDGSGDYFYASNAESAPGIGSAAVSAIHFGPDGSVRDAYKILDGTLINCAGGATPWGTWLSGEEHDAGQIWECDPFRPSQGVARPALGFYAHEAAAVDAIHRHVYLTEDETDGRLYRFVPRAYPDLSVGRLEVAAVDAAGHVTWLTVSDGAVGASRPRPAGSTAFNGGEGIFCRGSYIYFTTKGDRRLWRLETNSQTLCVLYDADAIPGAPLRGVDNVVVSRAGEVLVAEDGDDMEINIVRAGEVVGPLLQLVDQDASEVAGPSFSPKGDKLYFSSQRARGGGPLTGIGVTYEVTGPFRKPAKKK